MQNGRKYNYSKKTCRFEKVTKALVALRGSISSLAELVSLSRCFQKVPSKRVDRQKSTKKVFNLLFGDVSDQIKC